MVQEPPTLGHEDAGENIAGLFSLVATCEANEINAQLAA